MPSPPRSRNSSRSSTRNSFKSASILENGGQHPLQDEVTSPDIAPQDEIELVSRTDLRHISTAVGEMTSTHSAAVDALFPPGTETEDFVNLHNKSGEFAGTRVDPTASTQRDRLPHKRFGLHTDQLRGQRPQGGLPMDYKQKYTEDPIYKETEENARVFHVYNDESEIFDNDMVIEAGHSLDILLVFAGLFASVLTTFVVQTSQSLSPDKIDVSNSLLREMIYLQRASENGTSFSSIPAADTTFTVSRTDVWVNGLWFISLALSLSTALLAVIAKQWLRQYSSFISGTARERALIRQFRYDGFEKWGVRLIIGLLPMILHMSLFLFLSGLVVFLLPLNNIVACVIAGIAGFLCGAYVITNTLPVIFIQCPYRTPLSEILNTLWGVVKIIPVMSLLFVMRPWWKSLLLMENMGVVRHKEDWMSSRALDILSRRFDRWSTPLKEVERTCANGKGKWDHPLGITGALSWLCQTTSDISAKAIVVEAIGSVYHPSLASSRTYPSIHEALEQQWTNILPRICAGEMFAEEDERMIERLMRGAFVTDVRLDNPKAGPIHCHSHTTLLAIAAYNGLTSRLFEDEDWDNISHDRVLSFLSERDDLSTELEAPIWIWWLLLIQAAGPRKCRDDIIDIDGNVIEPDLDTRERWLKRVHISSTLQRTIRERILHEYNTEKSPGIQWPISPYALTMLSRFFLARIKHKNEPTHAFSMVSLATFLFDNFSPFADFWMKIGDVHSHIRRSSSTGNSL